MARELFEELMAKAKQLRRDADQVEETARVLRRQESSKMVVEGKLVKKPDGWQVADDIKKKMESGTGSMERQELIDYLVDSDLVKGSTRNYKIAAAKRSITTCLAEGYLTKDGSMLTWTGTYVNERVRKYF